MDGPESDVVVGLTAELRSAVLDNLGEGVYFVDRERRILYWNHGAEDLTGFSAPDVVGHHCHDDILSHCDASGTLLCGSGCPLRATIRDGRRREAHVFLRHKDGHRQPVCVRATAIRNGAGEIIGAVETFHDDSSLVDSRRRAHDLRRAALSDPLTGVGNRRLGDMLLHAWLEQHRRFQRPFGVLFVDLDGFKRVNDGCGHTSGDRALRAVAQTLLCASRRDDEVIRWGGDEFIVLVTDANAAMLHDVGQRLGALVSRTGVRTPSGERMALSVSIGGTLAAHDDTAATIMRRADTFLYRSKSAGGDHITIDAEGAIAKPAPAVPAGSTET